VLSRCTSGIRRRRTLALIALAVATGGCDSGDEGEAERSRPYAQPRAAAPVVEAGEACPVTLPDAKPPFEGRDFNYGNRWLGAALWRNGRLVGSRGGQTWGQIMRDGSISAKVGWWRAVAGGLTIQGERLDGPAPPLRASVPAGYGIRGFQATGLTFPTVGCWWVVGSVAGHDLDFVVRVTKRRPV
jgi:hypothetical protein